METVINNEAIGVPSPGSGDGNFPALRFEVGTASLNRYSNLMKFCQNWGCVGLLFHSIRSKIFFKLAGGK